MRDFFERLNAIVDKYADGNVSKFAKMAGVKPTTLHTYITKKRHPNFEVLAKIRQRFGVRLDWLADGDGPMTDDAPPPRPKASPPDEKLLARCIAAVEAALDDADLELNPAGKAEFILLLYQEQARAPEPAAKRLVSIFGR